MKPTLIFNFLFFAFFHFSCVPNDPDLEGMNETEISNYKANELQMSSARDETKVAFDSLCTMFNNAGQFKITQTNCKQVDSVDTYIPSIPDEVHLYYTVDKSSEEYCSKFIVDKDGAHNIFHKLTREQTSEFEEVENDIDETINNSIDEITTFLDSLSE